MSTVTRDPSVLANDPGNWTVLVMAAMTKARKTTDEWLDAVLVMQGLLDLVTKEQMATWQKEAAALPDAGKTMKDKESNVNGRGIGLTGAAGLGGAGIGGIIALMAFGSAAGPIGAFIGLVVGIAVTLACLYTAGQDNKKFMNVVDAHADYDSGTQLHQNSLVQQAQTAVQTTMQSKQQNVTQYFNPGADTKQQTSSMWQNMLACFKSMSSWNAA